MLLIIGSTPFVTKIAGFIKNFDYLILAFFNSFAGRSWYFDNFVRSVCDSTILKSGLLVAVLWWYWFRPSHDQEKQEVRIQVISALAAAFFALILARLLAFILPFRIRPIADAALNLRAPLGSTTNPIINWSAFPSDHLVYFKAIGLDDVRMGSCYHLLAQDLFGITLSNRHLGRYPDRHYGGMAI